MTEPDFPELGDPDVRVAGLKLWIRRREFPDATDRWDANWLETVAHCTYSGARVTTVGPFLRTDELAAFAEQCQNLHATLLGNAALDCMEPYLCVSLTGNPVGHIAVVIRITPDHLQQQHEFRDEIDQSHLPAIVAGCREILRRFPVLGTG